MHPAPPSFKSVSTQLGAKGNGSPWALNLAQGLPLANSSLEIAAAMTPESTKIEGYWPPEPAAGAGKPLGKTVVFEDIKQEDEKGWSR